MIDRGGSAADRFAARDRFDDPADPIGRVLRMHPGCQSAVVVAGGLERLDRGISIRRLLQLVQLSGDLADPPVDFFGRHHAAADHGRPRP